MIYFFNIALKYLFNCSNIYNYLKLHKYCISVRHCSTFGPYSTHTTNIKYTTTVMTDFSVSELLPITLDAVVSSCYIGNLFKIRLYC